MRDMPSRPRVAVPISAVIHGQLKAEADNRGLSVTRLAELPIERGLDQLPPVPFSDQGN